MKKTVVGKILIELNEDGTQSSEVFLPEGKSYIIPRAIEAMERVKLEIMYRTGKKKDLTH